MPKRRTIIIVLAVASGAFAVVATLLVVLWPQTQYRFAITDHDGRRLGTGTLSLPFDLEHDDNGVGRWTFAVEPGVDADSDTMAARILDRLSAGKGDLHANSLNRVLSLNFNPEWTHNNLYADCDFATGTTGTVIFLDQTRHDAGRITFFSYNESP